jgi:hypothetical protein
MKPDGSILIQVVAYDTNTIIILLHENDPIRVGSTVFDITIRDIK